MRVRTHVLNLFNGRGFFFVRDILAAEGVRRVLLTVDAVSVLPPFAGVLRLLDRRRTDRVGDEILQAVESALREAPGLLTPRAVWATRPLVAEGEDLVVLGRTRGESPLRWHRHALPPPLADAGRASLVLVTLGPELEDESTAAFRRGEYLRGLALDAVGTGAVHRLMAWTRAQVIEEARQAGFQASVPAGPGYGRWPLDDLPAVAAAAGGPLAGVAVTSGLMLGPGKSLCRVIPWLLEKRGERP